MTPLTLFFALLAGAGGGLAWGYRTALSVALRAQPKPREPQTSNLLPVGSKQNREEYSR